MDKVKKALYAIMVVFSAFFLVSAGVKEQQALEVIPDLKQ